MTQTQKKMRVAVSVHAVMARFARKLKVEGKKIKAPRGRYGGGFHYIVDTRSREIVATDLDETKLLEMARESGVIADWEEVK